MPCPYELAFLSNFIIIQLVEEVQMNIQFTKQKLNQGEQIPTWTSTYLTDEQNGNEMKNASIPQLFPSFSIVS